MKNLLSIFLFISAIVPNILSQELNPGDGVRVTFLNILDQITGDYYVQQDGNIQLPFIGIVKTTNTDYKEIKRTIFTKYSELYKEPALTVQPLFRINILGEVKTPGYYYVTDVEKMTGILALAGGVTGSAASEDIYIIRNNEEILLNTAEIIEKGNTVADIGLKSGDRIFIPRSFWANAGQYGIIISGLALLSTILIVVFK